MRRSKSDIAKNESAAGSSYECFCLIFGVCWVCCVTLLIGSLKHEFSWQEENKLQLVLNRFNLCSYHV